jgi:hypothetical protein
MFPKIETENIALKNYAQTELQGAVVSMPLVLC